MWQVRKKTLYWSLRHWIYFKVTTSILFLYVFVTSVQIQCPFHPFLYTLLLNCIPSPCICIFFLFPVIYLKFAITRTFFDFPSRFKLSGVDCSYNHEKASLSISSPTQLTFNVELSLYVYNDIFLDLTCVSWGRGISFSCPVVQAHYLYKNAVSQLPKVHSLLFR